MKLLQKLCRFNMLPPNYILDRICSPEEFKNLKSLPVELQEFYIPRVQYVSWVKKYFPRWRLSFRNVFHKKLIEFYVTFSLLEIGEDEVYMDVGGGRTSYIEPLQCRRKILQDITITKKTKETFHENVEFIESSAGKISVDTLSVDKISSHHSFEHFKGNTDIEFIREIQRILSKRGRCCIVPIFIANRYIEVTDRISLEDRSDTKSLFLIDPTATLPGGHFSGNYARIYDLLSFNERVINNIDMAVFQVKIYEIISEDGTNLPDPNLRVNRGASKINFPYRILLIERRE